jgi:hypothetical protein
MLLVGLAIVVAIGLALGIFLALRIAGMEREARAERGRAIGFREGQEANSKERLDRLKAGATEEFKKTGGTY